MSCPAIAPHVRRPLSTVGVVLRRCRLGRLTALTARPSIIRCERERLDELIHIDIKKLGRIKGIGHRITGDRTGQSNGRGIGWEYLHVVVDDRSRLAYTQLLPTERKEDPAAFLNSGLAWFSSHGVVVERVMTDNGSAYKSRLGADWLASAHGARHRRDSVYLLGAICPERAVGAAIILPVVSIEEMNLHLEEISSQVAPRAVAAVICDGAGWHLTGRELTVPDNIVLVTLPPYSPELNPMENVRQYLRE